MTETDKQDTPSPKSEVMELVSTIFWALVIALVIRSFLFQPFHIPTGSMYPQLMVGDYLLASKYSYGYSKYSFPFSPGFLKGRLMAHKPKRGDIIVFKKPPQNHEDYIKRVIGLPNDRIQMKEGRLWLNGKPVASRLLGEEALTENGKTRVVLRVRETLPNGKSYITWDSPKLTRYDNTPEYRVPKGTYFMMGDNRDNSWDSRGWGPVPEANLIGRGEVVLVSVNSKFRLLRPWTWFNFRKRLFISLRKNR